MFVLCKGSYDIAKLPYSYSRRAQSTVRTLAWKQVALIHTDDCCVAIAAAQQYVSTWKPSFLGCRWMVEGLGVNLGFEQEIDGQVGVFTAPCEKEQRK